LSKRMKLLRLYKLKGMLKDSETCSYTPMSMMNLEDFLAIMLLIVIRDEIVNELESWLRVD
jgi:hypothetical protein